MTVFGDQIQTALEDPSRINWWRANFVGCSMGMSPAGWP